MSVGSRDYALVASHREFIVARLLRGAPVAPEIAADLVDDCRARLSEVASLGAAVDEAYLETVLTEPYVRLLAELHLIEHIPLDRLRWWGARYQVAPAEAWDAARPALLLGLRP